MKKEKPIGFVDENVKDFSAEAMRIVTKQNCTYLEAVLDICDKYEIDPGACKPLLTKPIIERLEADFAKLNMGKKRKRKKIFE